MPQLSRPSRGAVRRAPRDLVLPVLGAMLAFHIPLAAPAAAPRSAARAGTDVGAEAAVLDALGRIRDEGFRRSEVMEVARHLTDVIGPRLTGSPAMRQANEWTRDQLAAWGLANAHLEPFPFGEGWTFERAAFRMTAPVDATLFGLPKAWTPGTNGPVRGMARQVKIESREDFEKVRGELAGTILFTEDMPKPVERDKDLFHRYDATSLADLCAYDIPEERDGEPWRERARKRWKLWQELWDDLAAAGVVGVVEPSSFSFGAVRLTGGGTFGIPDTKPGLPQVVLTEESYSRVLRLLEEGQEVELELDVAVTFHREDPTAWNTIAELPGGDLADEIVTIGAHLDSWHAGTGATDNAAGSAVVMEAMRILKSLGITPRRTIRVALWSAEEQGLQGARAHVAQHYATRPENTDPEQLAFPARYRDETWPITPKPAHAKHSVYFNLDNGGGRVSGVWAQENLGAKMVLERWIKPLADLGVTAVTMENTGSTDHIAFDQVGLPGFQLIQDMRDYMTRTHHSHLDTYDALERDDLMQASVVMASLAWQAAVAAEPMPRKPMPQEPKKKKEEKGAAKQGAAADKPAEGAGGATQAASADPSAAASATASGEANPANAATPAAAAGADAQAPGSAATSTAPSPPDAAPSGPANPPPPGRLAP
jgi:carboxypeptidase Q